ncbi:MAG TPA: DUF4276 family protein [Planctomycetes bacterium]|nr:DUF4276 family protein [Planctomycetota bacterium]
MSARLHFIVEGQTEETFVKRVLIPYLEPYSVWGDVRCVMTSRKRGVKYRGGLNSYAQAKNDIVLWMKEDRHADACFTTMFDLYALPGDFPGFPAVSQQSDPFQRVAVLENALKQDIGHPHFVPYIQLHEFEALLLADPTKLLVEYCGHDEAVDRLMNMVGDQNPETINDGPDTAPSRRIIREIQAYERQKALVGPSVAEMIGLPKLRAKCGHFDEWLKNLEALAQHTSV